MLILKCRARAQKRGAGGTSLIFRAGYATEAISTFYSALGGASRVVGRSFDYRRILSAVVGFGVQRTDCAARVQLSRSVLRRIVCRRGYGDGFGRSIRTAELSRFPPIVRQGGRGGDHGVGARFLLGDVLAQRIGRFTRCRQLSMEGDTDLAGLRSDHARYLSGYSGPRAAEASNRGAWRRRTGGTYRQAGAERRR